MKKEYTPISLPVFPTPRFRLAVEREVVVTPVFKLVWMGRVPHTFTLCRLSISYTSETLLGE